VLDGAVLNLAADLANLKPVHVPQRLGSALDPVADRLVDPFGRGSDNLSYSVGAIRHAARMACHGPTYDRGMGLLGRKQDSDVVRITAAPHNPNQDIDRRQGRYILSMSIRTACFLGAVFAAKIPWLCGVLIAAAFLLPFVAVVIANVASPRVIQDLEGPGVRGRTDYGELGSHREPTD
jgi:hypothetical protein